MPERPTHYKDELAHPLDIAIRNAHFEIWNVNKLIVPFSDQPDADVIVQQENYRWERIGTYIPNTLELVYDFHYKRQKSLASPSQYLKALEGVRDMGRMPYVCLFQTATYGMNNTGYAALIACQGVQRSMISIASGDGWGADCMVAVVDA